jgi:hypothetical protein
MEKVSGPSNALRGLVHLFVKPATFASEVVKFPEVPVVSHSSTSTIDNIRKHPEHRLQQVLRHRPKQDASCQVSLCFGALIDLLARSGKEPEQSAKTDFLLPFHLMSPG